MLIWIVMLKNSDDNIVTDVVGFSDVVKATQCAHDLSLQFGRENVSETSLIVDALPVYFGLVPPKAAEQSVQWIGGESAASQALSTPEVNLVGQADSTPPTNH